jgi:membrane protein YqaA with SNARE-associated domain
MLRRTYDWMMRLAESRHATPAMFAISFAESSFFPIPPDVMLAPMTVARPDRAYTYAFICTVASVLGGMLGYAIGYYLEPVGRQLLVWMGHADSEAELRRWFDQWGLWVILAKGLTPIPYKIVTITAGLAHFNIGAFIFASMVARGGRFYLTAWLLKRYGPSIREQVERRLALWTGVGIALIVGAILAVRLVG